MSFLDEQATLLTQLEERALQAEAKYEKLVEFLNDKMSFYDVNNTSAPPITKYESPNTRVWYLKTTNRSIYMRDLIHNQMNEIVQLADKLGS